LNPRRLLAIGVKETLQVWRDPRSLALALAIPLMQMALLGYGVSLDIKRVPLCVFDQAHSQASRGLVESFVASGWFAPMRDLASDRAVRAAMNDGACIGAVTIPVDFDRVLTATGNAPVQVVFDATDTNTTNVAIGYAQGVIARATADFALNWARAHGVPPQTVGTVDLAPRVWFNEGLDSRNFIIPGVVAMVLALIGAQLTSLTIAREWERGTMEQLISTPVTPLEMLLGKLVPYFLIGLFDAALCLVAAVFWFGVPFRGAVATLAAATALFTLVVLGIGYILSVRLKTQVRASQIALFVTLLPTILLSGFIFPIDQMPAPIRAVTWLVYPRYFVTILRAVFLKGSSFADLIVPFAVLTGFAAGIVAIAARAFRKRLD
jgi:ABC-2 type transport system permease protein